MTLLILSPISLLPLSGDHVVERAARRDLDQAVRVGLGLVRDVLHEQQRQDVVLVLAGVHAAAQLVSTLHSELYRSDFFSATQRPSLTIGRVPTLSARREQVSRNPASGL